LLFGALGFDDLSPARGVLILGEFVEWHV
jgi:hypothetical protein